MSHPRVLIVEDHPLMADALRVQLQALLAPMVCVHAHSLTQALWCLQQPLGFDLVVLDVNLPDAQGLDTLHAVCAARSSGPLVVLTARQDDELIQACVANNLVHVHKSSAAKHLKSVLLAAMAQQRLANGLVSEGCQVREAESLGIDKLSNTQRLVLAALAQGLSSREVAQHMRLGESTVRSHMTQIYQRLGVKNRTQACTLYVRWTQQQGIAHD